MQKRSLRTNFLKKCQKYSKNKPVIEGFYDAFNQIS